VQAEDSLETIAERFNTTVEAIIEFNPQITTQGVGVGDVIRIPVEGTPEANTP
jgi:LysM repeat protein